mmetsp:Transcript_76265/g.210984  ORF Transcript_76265/g.210984 Transcript_76265/m.210984 type:complete len:82 (-) Transcript_76265:303-548(-)
MPARHLRVARGAAEVRVAQARRAPRREELEFERPRGAVLNLSDRLNSGVAPELSPSAEDTECLHSHSTSDAPGFHPGPRFP